MAAPYIGEIRLFAGNFAPLNWLLCNGQLLQIDQYYALYSLIGTTYGGDGQTTFAVPDLRGRVPVHQSTTGFAMGQTGGAETVTLTTAQLPSHPHTFYAWSGGGTQRNPAANVTAAIGTGSAYIQGTPGTALAAGSIGYDGGGTPHENRHPYQCISFIISLWGAYPSKQ
jgi:microcystin-dependent protein